MFNGILTFQFMLGQLGAPSWSVRATPLRQVGEGAGAAGLTVLVGKRRSRSAWAF